jgi:glycosyltransferase involved in cell wall biosynthesis
MKCLIVHNYYQKRGGEDAVFEAEGALLAAAGHEVEYFTVHNDTVKDYSKIGLLGATVWNHGIYRQLAYRLREFRPDVVHFHNTFPLISLAAVQAAKDAGATVIMTLHNFRFICPSANLYRNNQPCELCVDRRVKWPAVTNGCYRGSRTESAAIVAMLAIHRAMGNFNGLVDRYIALSHHSRALFLQAGFSPEKIVVKPNFVPAALASDSAIQRAPFVLFVGRMVPDKGVLTLLKAWNLSDAPDAPLIMVGEGPLAANVRAAGGRVKLLASRDRSEVYRLMQQASLLVFPSEWYEPFGLVVVEAFANGLPVAAARIGAAEELIDSGRTGFFFNPGDPLSLAATVRDAFERPKVLAAMGASAAADYHAKFTPSRNLKLLEAIYHEAVKPSRTPAEFGNRATSRA